jgi:hypothetical protein
MGLFGTIFNAIGLKPIGNTIDNAGNMALSLVLPKRKAPRKKPTERLDDRFNNRQSAVPTDHPLPKQDIPHAPIPPSTLQPTSAKEPTLEEVFVDFFGKHQWEMAGFAAVYLTFKFM